MLLSVIVGLSTGAALLIVSLPKVYASTVGPNSPTAAATVANGSSTSWTNPTNAEASDGVYASVGLTKNGISDYLETTGYSFAVPSTATIDGIYVQVQKYATSTSDDSIADQTVSLVVGGSVAGSNLATTSTWPSTDTSTYYGSSTNLWGNSLTPSQINAGNFGVAVAVQDVHATGKATNVTAYVDYVSVTVYYSTSISLNQSSYQLYQNQAGSPAGGANWSEATGGAAWSARSFQSSLVYDNKMWIMGGYNALGSSYYNDVWYSTNGVNWTEATSAASWAVREGATALVYNNEMWIMSGWSSSSGYYNDVWYSTNGVNWTEATSAASWTVRYEATSLVYNNEMWIMGGTGSSGYLNDVWYSSNGVNWTEATSAAPWVVRSGATSLVYDNEMWIMGGSYNNNYYNDVWFSTLPPISVGSSLAAQNTAATVPGNQQPFRLRQDIAVTGSNLAANSLTLQLQYALMSGGSCSATPAANYSNVTDHSTIQYYQNQYAANGQSLNTTSGEPTDGSNTIVPEEYLGYGTTTFSNPAAINAGEDGMWDFALTTYNALPGQQYCFQIISGGAALNTYTDYPEIIIPASTITQSSYRFYQNKDATTSTASWTEATSAAPWAGRDNFTSLVYNNEMWIMGGSNASGNLNDVWYSSNGVNWTEATSAAPWAARFGATSLVYNNEMWIMGGYGASYYKDVWYSSNGVNWTEATSAAPWAARYGATSMVYNNEMWIMGGFSSGDLNDVWYSSNGVNWTEATSAAPWAARNGATSLVYNNEMWIMDGVGASYYNDVWYSSNGVNWTEATSAAPWAARYGDTSLVYNNEMWIMGGINGSTYYNDVWYSSNGVNWTEATSAAPWAARFGATSLVYNNEMWIMGGSNGSTFYNDVWYYAVPMIDVGSPLSNQNTPVDLNGPALKQPFRLRLDIAIGESQQQSNNLSLELQYAELGDYANCSSVPSTNYANVSSTTPIQYYTNVVATNGMALLPDANDPTDGSNMIVYQTYNQANPFVNAQGTIYAGEDGLWDFALAVSSSSYDHASYCLRVANSSNGSAINTYTDYPQINLAPTMSQVMNFRNWWNSSGVQQNLDIYHD